METNFIEGLLNCDRSLVRFLEKTGLRDCISPDHVGYKCSSTEEYEAIKSSLLLMAELENETVISGRRIAYFKLGCSIAISTEAGAIEYVELQDQKPDNSQTSRFDHLEIVPKGINHSDLIDRIETLGYTVAIDDKSHHTTWRIVAPDQSTNDGPILKISIGRLIEKIREEELSSK